MKIKKNKLISVISLFMVMLFLISCNNKEQKIKFGFLNTISNLDPVYNQFVDENILTLNLFEGLMTYDKDKKLVLGIADNYDISEDGLTYTFKLKDNIKWSNGEEVVAEDFKYSWLRFLELETPLSQTFDIIKNVNKFFEKKVTLDEVGIEVLDKKTLKVTLESPSEAFLDIVASGPFLPMNKKSIEEKDKWVSEPSTYVSNGPFKLKEFSAKHRIIVEKNNKYHNAKEVKLEEINFSLMTDMDLAYSGLKSGEYDIINNLGISKVKDAKENNLLASFNALNIFIIEINPLGKNVSEDVKKFLSNKQVREAMSISINRAEISNTIGAPAYSYIPPGMSVYKGKDFNDKKYYDDNEQNINKAKELLNSAGYGKDGMKIPQIEILYYGKEIDTYIFNKIKEYWNEIGIDVKLNFATKEKFVTLMSNNDYEVMKLNYISAYKDINSFFAPWLTNPDSPKGSFNNKKYDELITNAYKESSIEKKLQNFKEAEGVIIDEKFIVPIYFPYKHIGITSNLKDVVVSEIANMYFKYAYLD